MSEGPHVLLVEGPSETRDVLEAVLGPRGGRVERIRRNAAPLGKCPDVLVLDLSEETCDSELPEGCEAAPRVIIGAAEVDNASQSERRIAHPFHYRDLIEQIESLLEQRRAA